MLLNLICACNGSKLFSQGWRMSGVLEDQKLMSAALEIQQP